MSIIKICYLILLVALFSCDGKKEKERAQFSDTKQRYISLEKRGNYGIAPDFDYFTKEKSKLNGEINRAIKIINKEKITSFITINELEKKKLLIYFSNDNFKLGNFLHIVVVSENDHLEVEFRDFDIIPNNNFGTSRIYNIPADAPGINTVKLTSIKDNLYFEFKFEVLENKKINEDSTMNKYYRDIMNRGMPIDLDSLNF